MISDINLNPDHAKILAMFILAIGSFTFGVLPAGISQRNRIRYPLLISLLLCFGAGVLLSTALIHMLPDVRETMPNFAELLFCAGFFLIYLIDEFVHYFFGEAIQHSHRVNTLIVGANRQHENIARQQINQNYGSNDETQALLSSANENRPTTSAPQTGNLEDCCDSNVANERICHVSHIEPATEAIMTGTFGLLTALSLHSLLEGLAIGVQSSSSKVILLFGAVACHKYVMSFCLGTEICSNPASSFKYQVMAILIFSLGSACGIGVGMAVVDLSGSWKTVIPVLQALAGGTLLYVTVCEVMPREKARWHQNRSRRAAGVFQFFAVILGFAIMTVINTYMED